MPDPLVAILDRLRRSTPGGESVEFAVTPLDVTGVAVWSVTRWQADGEMINGIGYGDSDLRALVGSWAELLEQAASHSAARAWRRRVASYDDLVAAGEAAIDPRSLRLPAGSDYTHDRPCVWVRASRYDAGRPWGEHEPVWTVLESAATHSYDLAGPGGEPFPFAPLYQPVSNGNGAGDTCERAMAHGLLELVQRDGNSAGYRACDRGVRVNLDDVRHPGTLAVLDALDGAGIEVIVKLADTNLGMANLYVVGHEREPAKAPHPIVLTGCGEAAHPDREAALNKALLEFCASRVRKLFTHGPIEAMEHLFPPGYLERFAENPATVEESRSFAAVRELAHSSADALMGRLAGNVFRVDSTVNFSDLPTVPMGSVDAIPDLLAETARRFDAEGLAVYWLDYTPGAAGPGDCYAVKAVCAPMEVETVTYRRVGVRNLRRLAERGIDFAGIGDPPPGADRVLLDDAAAAEVGDAWLHPERLERQVGDLYALYREPEIHAIALHDRAATSGRPSESP